MFKQNITLSPGTENFTSHSLEIVIMLLGAFLLGFLLRHFLNWGKKNLENHKLEVSNWKNKYNGVSSEYAEAISKIEILEGEKLSLRNQTEETPALRLKIIELEREITQLKLSNSSSAISEDLKEKLAECNALNASLYNKIKALQANEVSEEEISQKINSSIGTESLKIEEIIIPVVDDKIIEPSPTNESSIKQDLEILAENNSLDTNIKKDDLKKIEGIGPKIASILNEKGIFTFAHLALSSEENLKAILHEQGDHYKIHEPGTWPEQASLALNGEWEKLLAWQKELKGGKKK